MDRIEQNSGVEIVKAIPLASRIKWVTFFVALGLALTWAGKTVVGPELRAYLSGRNPVEAFRRFQWVMIGVGASLVPFAVYFAWFAARIIRSGQFPHPGATVWRDTPVVRGGRALARGWALAFCALVLLGLAVYAAYIPSLLAKHQRSMSTNTVATPSMGVVD
jgi:hypothetical protein